MNTKPTTSAGCLLLLVAALTPSVLGHDERQSFVGTNVDGVSGRYVGPTGVAIVPNGDANPQDTITLGFGMLCDFEVAGTGASVFPQDETHVDSFNTANLVGDNVDDGGYGGACHTNHYGLNGYNTAGCPAAAGHAYDDASDDVWILASCDWKTVIGGTPSEGIFITCVANAVLTLNVGIIPGCVLAFVACVVAPVSCTVGGTDQCGADAVADGGNYGHGSSGANYPRSSAQVGDFFLDDVPPCIDPTDATAAVFVFGGVTVDGADSHVHPATVGEVYESGQAQTPPKFVREPIRCIGRYANGLWHARCVGLGAVPCAVTAPIHGGTDAAECTTDPKDSCRVHRVTAYVNLLAFAPDDEAWTSIHCTRPTAPGNAVALANDKHGPTGSDEPFDSHSVQGNKTSSGIYTCHFEVDDDTGFAVSSHACRERIITL